MSAMVLSLLVAVWIARRWLRARLGKTELGAALWRVNLRVWPNGLGICLPSRKRRFDSCHPLLICPYNSVWTEWLPRK